MGSVPWLTASRPSTTVAPDGLPRNRTLTTKGLLMKKLWARTLAASVVAFGIGGAGLASAQTLEPTATTQGPQPLGETSPLRLSITVAPMPAGTFKLKAGP